MRQITRSTEFDRIKVLPRRKWEDLDLDKLTELLTEHVKTKQGTMKLRHIQTAALSEMHDENGLFGSISVGYGKSLICYLSPTVLEAKRPLLLIPAKLKTKTERELETYGDHFNIGVIKVISYELLSRDRGQKELLEYAPDLIISDECHRLKNLKAACTKRVKRYMKDNPDTRMIAVSGTITRKSLMDYQHILVWCLKEKAPIPLYWREAMDWSLALDEQLPFGKFRIAPGVLMQFTNQAEYFKHAHNKKEALNEVRRGYKTRLTESPGVIATADSYEGSSLLIKTDVVKQPEIIHEHFDKLRSTWTMPDGKEIVDAVEMWRHAREFGCGFYYRWETPPPKNWRKAQKEWAQFVRSIVAHNRKGIDTEFQVAAAVLRGEYTADEYNNWTAIRGTFKPKTTAVWLSDHVLTLAQKWLDKNKGIVWVEHLAFGEALSKLSGYPFFSGGGKERLTGQIIEDAKGPIIASIAANAEGRNLQSWDKNLIISCTPSAQLFEQLVGRTHRPGQESDEVSVEILLTCREGYDGLNNIISQAQYVENTTGQIQKILYADKDIHSPSDIKDLAKKEGAVWKNN